MKNYEFIYLIPDELSEEDQQILQSKIISFIQESKGILNNIINNPVVKKLAYPIKKKTQAFLTVLDFWLGANVVKDFEKKIKKQNQILRYLILEKKIFKVKDSTVKISKKILPSSSLSFSSTKKIEKPKIKVEIKEIEEKLEEILSEN